jgi:hypothetical protein
MTYLLINNDFSVTDFLPATGRLLVGRAAIVKNWVYRTCVYDEI